MQEVGEACDDGNTQGDDYCSPGCDQELSICGDGERTLDEACDQGLQNTDDYQLNETCLSDCSGYGSYCGDGERDAEDGEACDNPDPSSGCTATCEKSPDVVCGDFITHAAFEGCDDGNAVTESCIYGQESCLVCNASCEVEPLTGEWCGDSIVQEEQGELCDSTTKPCTELSSVFASGTATCGECSHWDTADCTADRADPEKMVQIPGGLFWQGCNYGTGTGQDDECYAGEVPYHQTQIDGFFMDTYEVTVGQYRACVDAGVCSDEEVGVDPNYCNYNFSDRDNHPINCVVWAEAQTYCAWAQKRLPTEAEWEKAARGTDGRKYPWGNSPAVSCTHVVMDEGGNGCGQGRTGEVGSKPLGVSPYGAHDMIGNVYEWTTGWYGSNYYCAGSSATYTEPFEYCGLSSPVSDDVTTNPQGLSDGVYRVLRGGSWGGSTSVNLRASNRLYLTPTDRGSGIGVRCSQ